MNLPIMDSLPLPRLAELWARETGMPQQEIDEILARAVVDSELCVQPADTIVFVQQDKNGLPTEIIPERDWATLPYVIPIVGAEMIPFSKVPSTVRTTLLKTQMHYVQQGAAMSSNSLCSLFLISREDFRQWSANRDWDLPESWFPRNTEQGPSGPSTRERKKKATSDRHDSWRRDADRMRSSNPHITDLEISRQIAKNHSLNPQNVSAETIRRQISSNSNR